MKTIVLAALAALFVAEAASATVYVNPYIRGDGTIVQGHTRSNPDGNPYNNWGY